MTFLLTEAIRKENDWVELQPDDFFKVAGGDDELVLGAITCTAKKGDSSGRDTVTAD